MRPNRVVVVADDDEDIREGLAAILRDEGFETRTAKDGEDTMLVLASLAGARCILLLDLMMPGMNGFDVLDALAGAHRLADVDVIVWSATAPRRALPVGIRQFITKPAQLDTLLEGVRNLYGAG